jgi:hypothetical protein
MMSSQAPLGPRLKKDVLFVRVGGRELAVILGRPGQTRIDRAANHTINQPKPIDEKHEQGRDGLGQLGLHAERIDEAAAEGVYASDPLQEELKFVRQTDGALRH